jgi:hypothetical protein
MRRIALALVALVSFGCHAEYTRTGPMVGTVCKGFVIKACEPLEIKALERNGSLYEVGHSFTSVSEYRNKKCRIDIDSFNVATKLIRAANNPNFYTKEKGEFVKINPDYLTFPCVEH